jgi:hypothetical protein
MDAYLQSFKEKIDAETCYTDIHKAFLCSLVDASAAEHPNDPEAVLAALVEKINGAGVDRSRELAKFCARSLYHFSNEKGDKDPATALAFLNQIVLQKV